MQSNTPTPTWSINQHLNLNRSDIKPLMQSHAMTVMHQTLMCSAHLILNTLHFWRLKQWSRNSFKQSLDHIFLGFIDLRLRKSPENLFYQMDHNWWAPRSLSHSYFKETLFLDGYYETLCIYLADFLSLSKSLCATCWQLLSWHIMGHCGHFTSSHVT